MPAYDRCLVVQSCLTLCDPMDYSLPDSSVHGILQAICRLLEWVAMPFSRGSSQPRDWTQVSRNALSVWGGFPHSSIGKECLQCRKPGFDSWVRKIPCRRKWQSTPVFLPGESHRQRSLASYSPWGRKSWTRLSNEGTTPAMRVDSLPTEPPGKPMTADSLRNSAATSSQRTNCLSLSSPGSRTWKKDWRANSLFGNLNKDVTSCDERCNSPGRWNTYKLVCC